MIRLLLVDDHALIREGLKKMIAGESGMKVVGEAANAKEALKRLDEAETDVVILDITLPGRSGIDVIEDVRERHPNTRILMLSMHPEESAAVQAIRAGASGYITKQAAPEELLKAIRIVASGKKYVSGGVADQLFDRLREPKTEHPHNALSPREYEILIAIATGKSVKEIAQILDISIPTVHTYRLRILEKMEMKTNAELIHYALRNKLIE